MKIFTKKYFKFVNLKNLFYLFCLITFISCASNTKLDELQNPEILEQNEKTYSDDENLEKSAQEENLSFSEQEYPQIEILEDEPNVFDEPIQSQTENENIQEIDPDINPYFETEENDLDNSDLETEILTENEELPKDISEFYSQENENSALQAEQSEQENNSDEENQQNAQNLTDESQTISEISELENQENLQNPEDDSQSDSLAEDNLEENSLNSVLNFGLQEVPSVEEINSLSETNQNQENSKDENKFDDEQKEIPVASRTMTMKQNQFLEVHYPGNGWVYLGEEDSKNLMRYMGRKIGTSDTIFTLRSRAQGTTLLHFYKNDALTGNFIDDYLEIQIKGKATDSEIAIAPSYEEIVPKRFNSASSIADSLDSEQAAELNVLAEDLTQTGGSSVPSVSQQSVSSSSQTVPSSAMSESSLQTSSSSVPEASSAQNGNPLQSENSPEEILKLAKDFYNNKNFSQSLNYVNEFLSVSNTKLDEALFLKAQILESSSEVQNIREALNAYESLLKSYPKSSYWKQASERATYIKRFYFNIR